MILSQFLILQNLEGKARFFSTLGDPTTLKIVKTLLNNNMICVSDIGAKTGNSISAVSHQLRKLRDFGLVKVKREGKMRCYILADNNKVKFLRQIL